MNGQLLILLVIFAVLIIPMFLASRRQRKVQQETQQMRSQLGIGDEVVTIGGFIGLIVEEYGDVVVLESENGAHLKYRRSAIASLAENLGTPEAPAQGGAADEVVETEVVDADDRRTDSDR